MIQLQTAFFTGIEMANKIRYSNAIEPSTVVPSSCDIKHNVNWSQIRFASWYFTISFYILLFFFNFWVPLSFTVFLVYLSFVNLRMLPCRLSAIICDRKCDRVRQPLRHVKSVSGYTGYTCHKFFFSIFFLYACTTS